MPAELVFYVLQDFQFQDLKSIRAISPRYNQLTLDHSLFATKLHKVTLILDDKFPENMYYLWRGIYWQHPSFSLCLEIIREKPFYKHTKSSWKHPLG